MTEVRFYGTGISAGLSVGKPRVLLQVNTGQLLERSIDEEVAAFEEAKLSVLGQIEGMIAESSSQEVKDILDSQLWLLKDPLFAEHISCAIRNSGLSAVAMLDQAMDAYKQQFRQHASAFYLDRLRDVVGIADRLRQSLCQGCPSKSHTGSIVVANELSLCDVASLKADCAPQVGLVAMNETESSHVAIVARAKGIPLVAGVELTSEILATCSTVLVDGSNGLVIVNPTSETLHSYRSHHFTSLPSHPRARVGELLCNLESEADFERMAAVSVTGIGLYRTELQMLETGVFPSEAAQEALYTRLARSCQGPCIIRIFDVGAEKFPHLVRASQGNSALGVRGVRFMLREFSEFAKQARALIRAAQFGDVRILIPMVSCFEEMQKARQLIEQEALDLRLPCPPIGCMLEVPASVLLAEQLAVVSDFFSIGSNDLTQYTLACDRTSRDVASLYQSLHPSVLRLFAMAALAAQKTGRPLTLCGEIAADPSCLPLLWALGLRSFSVTARALPVVAGSLSEPLENEELAELSLACSTQMEVRALLAK